MVAHLRRDRELPQHNYSLEWKGRGRGEGGRARRKVFFLSRDVMEECLRRSDSITVIGIKKMVWVSFK